MSCFQGRLLNLSASHLRKAIKCSHATSHRMHRCPSSAFELTRLWHLSCKDSYVEKSSKMVKGGILSCSSHMLTIHPVMTLWPFGPVCLYLDF